MMGAAGSVLVRGAAGATMEKITLEVVRAFVMAGERQEVGSIVEVGRTLASELINANKARRVEAPAQGETKAETPAAQEPAPAQSLAEKVVKRKPRETK